MDFLAKQRELGMRLVPNTEVNNFHRRLDVVTGEVNLFNCDIDRCMAVDEILEFYGTETKKPEASFDEKFLATILMEQGLPRNPPKVLLEENLKAARKALGEGLIWQRSIFKEYQRKMEVA